jgi:sigma-B regulation protein RsbU (phosphoserine phosphatase)
VLIIDDTRTNRAFLGGILKEDGYHVLQAVDGESGIEIAIAEKPALILLDVVMPGIDGFETLQRLKANPATKNSAVIMLTASDDQASKLRAFEYGAVDYIIKSTNRAEVRARVRVHIRLAKTTEDLMEAQTASLRQIGLVQKSMLVNPEDLPDAKFAVYFRSLHEAGGDFYEVLPVGDGVFFYFLGDIAGHDVATSFLTPAIKVLLQQFTNPMYDLHETLGRINDILVKTVMGESYFTTAALRINRNVGKADFLTAGHPPIIYLPHQKPATFVSNQNGFIGMFEETVFQSSSMAVTPRDRFILFTDGLAEDAEASRLWPDALEDVLAQAEKCRTLEMAQIPQALLAGMGISDAKDDVAILVVEV